MKTDGNANHQLTPEGKFALYIMACEDPAIVLVLLIGSAELAVNAGISVAIFMIALRATWQHHNKLWYWFAAAFAMAIEVSVNTAVPWSNHAFRGVALVPFGALDYAIVYGFIKLAENLMKWADG